MGQVNLHQHSDGSLLDGSVGVREIAEHAEAIGAEAIAITDHNEVNQHPAFYKACTERGLHPVLGMEGDWVDTMHSARFDDDGNARTYPHNRSHICLLAENNQGLHNLWAMSTLAYSDEYKFHKPLLTIDLLKQYSKGIYASDGCLITEFARAIGKGDDTWARKQFTTLRDIYGDHFYVELHTWQFCEPNDVEKIKFFGEQITTRQANRMMTEVNEAKLAFAREYGVPWVIVNDAHYAHRDNWERKELVWKFSTSHRNKGDDQDQEEERSQQKADWLMNADECYYWMAQHGIGADVVTEGIKNAAEIAFKCNTTITRTLDMPRLGASEEEDFRDLVKLVEKGFRDKVSKAGLDEEVYHHRLVNELSLIRDKGFAGYFMVEHDLIDAAVTGKWVANGQMQPMLVGPGRGSAGGCLVTYLLGITSLDPIHYDLLFERFLAPGRKDWPDIDVDFPQSLRPGAKEYLEHRHGGDCVCTIGTLGRSGPKALLRDLGRALRIDGAVIDKIARIVDKVKTVEMEVDEGGEEISWDEIFEQQGGELKAYNSQHPGLFGRIKDMDKIIRNSSKHASGVVVSNKPLLGNIPLRSKKNQLVTQFDMYEVEELGAVKLDLLGLRHLDTLMYARNLIYERHGVWLDFRDDQLPQQYWGQGGFRTGGVRKSFTYADYAEEGIWDQIGEGHTLGIFQIETAELSRMSKDLKPQNEKDVAALISIVRPGVKDAKLDRVYLDRRNGHQPVAYDHPMMEPITTDTYGVMIYQEQLLKAVQILGGFTPDESDDLRKALGKKKMDKVMAFKEKFVEGCLANSVFMAGIPRGKSAGKISETIWASVEASGRYAFNKSHAVGYAIISTWEIWTKSHYPLEFMCALLATDGENINKYVRECRRMKIEVLPPDVNESNMHFTLDRDVNIRRIRYGLQAIKGLGSECVRELVNKRGFSDVVDLATRCDSKKVGKGKVEALISIGALDSMEYNEAFDGDFMPSCRERLYMQYHDFRIFSKAAPSVQARIMRDDPSGYMRAQHIEAWRIRNKGKASYEAEFNIPYFHDERVVYDIEQELVGNYILMDPVAKHIEYLESLPVLAEPTDLDQLEQKDECYIGGLLLKVKPVTVKKKGRWTGREMAFLEIGWNELIFDVTAFPESYDRLRNILEVGRPICCLVARDAQSCHVLKVERLDMSRGQGS